MTGVSPAVLLHTRPRHTRPRYTRRGGSGTDADAHTGGDALEDDDEAEQEVAATDQQVGQSQAEGLVDSSDAVRQHVAADKVKRLVERIAAREQPDKGVIGDVGADRGHEVRF